MKRKIIVALSLIFTLFTIGTAATIYSLTTTTANLRSLITLHEIEDIRLALNMRVQRVLTYIQASREDFDKNIPRVIHNTRLMDKAIKHCHDCHHEPKVQRELDASSRLSKKFQERLSYIMTTEQDNPWRRENQKQAYAIGSTIQKQVQQMVNRAASTIHKRTDAAMARIALSYKVLFSTLALALCLAFFVARHLLRSITRPIEALLTATRHLTAGELGYQTEAEGPEEFQDLFQTFNEMSASLAQKEKKNQSLTAELRQNVEALQKTQTQLVQAGKMAALGTLAGGIAHDFNNILCGILSNVNLLQRAKDLSPQEQNVLETIEKAGNRASDLVHQLLTFARQNVEKVLPVSLNIHINNVIRLLRSGLPGQISLSLDLDRNLPVIQGDPARLEQVILNLCVNARDAMPKGGELKIETRAVELDDAFCTNHPEAKKGPYAVLRVADTGMGMEEEVLSRLFEPFYTTKPFGHGAGLGLAMVHGIVESHHGFCLVESTVGKGSSFTVYLPIAEPQGNPIVTAGGKR